MIQRRLVGHRYRKINSAMRPANMLSRRAIWCQQLAGMWLLSEITQGKGAYYCLGASGHGYQVCSRDAANDTIGGATIKAATTGFTFDF